MTKMINIGNNGRLGPGPGKYLLPTNVGYDGHDFTRYRNPRYTIAPRLGAQGKPLGPGPKYQLEYMSRVGKDSPPAYSMSSRPKGFTLHKTPGPAEYFPKRGPIMPSYSMRSRHGVSKQSGYPGPDKYMLPTTIGPKVPDKRANAAYSMSYKHHLAKTTAATPGPANYGPTDPDLYRNTLPKYSMRPHLGPPESKFAGPGPKYYPKLSPKSGYSFGLRLNNTPYITAMDEIPCT